MANSIKLNRQQLAQFLPTAEAIKAFESLFESVQSGIPTSVDDVQATADAAQLKAAEALSQLADIANALSLSLYGVYSERTPQDVYSPLSSDQPLPQDAYIPPAVAGVSSVNGGSGDIKNVALTTDKLSQFAATTSAELAGVISDETGSGKLVFATSPALTTPDIGAATGTSVNLSGSATTTNAIVSKISANGGGTPPSAGSLQIGGNGSNRWLYNVPTGGEHDLQVNGSTVIAVNASLLAPIPDNTVTCGTASLRWSVVYAATGTINTSDKRTKTEIEDISEVEKRVAIKVKGLIKKFKFIDAVEKKGEQARIHFGVIAQEVIDAFESEGLDAARYALLCYDKWDDIYEPEISTRIVTNEETGEETEESYVSGERLIVAAGERFGIRYDQLLAFVISSL